MKIFQTCRNLNNKSISLFDSSVVVACTDVTVFCLYAFEDIFSILIDCMIRVIIRRRKMYPLNACCIIICQTANATKEN